MRSAGWILVFSWFQSSSRSASGLFQHQKQTIHYDEKWEEQEEMLNSTVSDLFVGTGIYDISGPAAQINMMGYARSTQTAHGIHMRLRSRAFIVSQPPSGRSSLRSTSRNQHQRRLSDDSQFDPETTICFVSIDTGMGSDLVSMQVASRLRELLPVISGTNKTLCHLDNLVISGTHTHSAPAGFLQYALYQVTSSGFSTEVFHAHVEGIALSIVRAYQNLQPGTITMARSRLLEANINRSPTSYLLNPLEERQQYIDGDTDKSMLQLHFNSKTGEPLGLVNWFAVHGTSMNASNLLISGDNKGYASYLMERYVNGNKTLPGMGAFVAAFASTNLGDVSPNTRGPRCVDTGLPCDLLTSTCNGRNAMCIASGPGDNMVESTEIIGRKQYQASLDLWNGDKLNLAGPVAFRHSFIDMANKTVVLENGDTVHTCPAALGYAFAAGTTDGPGDFDFTQGQNSSNAFWRIISGFLSPPTEEQKRCHHPKPILLNTGSVTLPYSWDPDSVPISVQRVGRLFILGVPCEFTTMAGRRLRKAIQRVATNHGVAEAQVTIAGLANSYTHYVATFEEYQGQRYEAASTLFGPHTLAAYIQEFERIVDDLLVDAPTSSDAPPQNLTKKQMSLIPPVIVDTIAIGYKFGSVVVDVEPSYKRGTDSAFVSFRSANPRNNQRIQSTFLAVDKLGSDGKWDTVFVDGDWCTQYKWKSDIIQLGSSLAEITWSIPAEAEEGVYRICHFGTRKTLISKTERFLKRLRGWFSMYILGPVGGSIFNQGVEISSYVSSNQGNTEVDEWLYRLIDFSGCSSNFAVQA
eukprot:Nitzschia sp. Nitz4//scaffold170_size48074//31888//34729//NITZ4_007109-RA/size48074-snap-gene-0.37-mRNA-1//1//CDS//3329538652//2185//frame0